MGGERGGARAVAATVVLVASALMLTGADWPSYLSDVQRDATSSETVLSVSDAPHLSKLWAYQTGATIAASATVVNSVVYVGSWDGYEYALDAKSGALKWRTNLGITTGNSNCLPSTLGVSSAATVVNGTVYVGGGDAYWYALDAVTGAVLWKVYTGDNSASGGHYNWASPLIANGYAYIGIASLGDCPLVQGQLLQVSLASHQVVNTFDVVPTGHVGGGIWTSPTLDQATNTIYVATGTRANSSDLDAEAVLAIDAGTDTLKDSWPLPASQETSDSDWSTTPTLLTANGTALVAAINKNGFVYAFPRNDLHDGYTWRTQVADPGSCPQCGSGSASSMAFAGGQLFAAGGTTTIAGTSYPGSVRALDPATGNITWAHPAPSAVVPALAADNGLVIDAAGSTLEVLDATSGSRLYAFAAPGGTTFYGAPSISNGEVFVGSTDGNLYAVGVTPAASGGSGLTGVVARPMQASPLVVDSASRLDGFLRGSDTFPYQDAQAPAGGTGSWGTWSGVTSPIATTSVITAAANADGHLELFAQGTDSSMYHSFQRADGTLSPWSQLWSNPLPAGLVPAISLDSTGALEMIVRSTTDNTLYLARESSANTSTAWSGLSQVAPNPSATDPVVVQRADGKLEVFVRSTSDGTIYDSIESATGVWSQFNLIGAGGAADKPVAVRDSAGGLDVVIEGTDGFAYAKRWAQTTGWSAWSGLGQNSFIGGPVAAVTGGGGLDVYVVGTNHQLYRESRPGAGGSWSGFYTGMGGTLRGDLFAANRYDGSPEVLAFGSSGTAYHADWVPSAGAWTALEAVDGSRTWPVQ